MVLGLSLGIHAVHREDALYVDLCPGRLLGEAVEQFPDVGGHLLGRHAGRQVVGADHQEQFLGMAVDDRIETVEQPSRTVGADAAVLDMAVVEQLGPLAAVGDAVPEKNDVVTPDRQLFEKAAFLIVVFVLGERCDRDEQSRGKENGFFISGFYFLIFKFTFIKLHGVFQPVVERIADQRMADRHLVRPRDAADEEAQVSRLRSCPAFSPSPWRRASSAAAR